jgi:hypothetical protein
MKRPGIPSLPAEEGAPEPRTLRASVGSSSAKSRLLLAQEPVAPATVWR